jgi:hypothetical protein
MPDSAICCYSCTSDYPDLAKSTTSHDKPIGRQVRALHRALYRQSRAPRCLLSGVSGQLVLAVRISASDAKQTSVSLARPVTADIGWPAQWQVSHQLTHRLTTDNTPQVQGFYKNATLVADAPCFMATTSPHRRVLSCGYTPTFLHVIPNRRDRIPRWHPLSRCCRPKSAV